MDRLRVKNGIVFDTETHKIQPGLSVPPLVVASVIDGDGSPRLLDRTQAKIVFASWLASDRVLIGANIVYDVCVMANELQLDGHNVLPDIFKAYADGRVYDVLIQERLHAIASGTLGLNPATLGRLCDPVTGKISNYSLSTVNWLLFGRSNAKHNDRWRLSYALLESTPICDWPDDAKQYPLDDVVNTRNCALAQVGLLPRLMHHDYSLGSTCSNCGLTMTVDGKQCPPKAVVSDNLCDHESQVRAAFAMQLGANRGLLADLDQVQDLKNSLIFEENDGRQKFIDLGWIVHSKKGFTSPQLPIKERVALCYGSDPSGKCSHCEGSGVVGKTCQFCSDTNLCDDSRGDAPMHLRPFGECSHCEGSGVVGKAKCQLCCGTKLELAPNVPRTAGGKCRKCKGVGCEYCAGLPTVIPGISTSRDTLQESGDEDLEAFAEYKMNKKLLQTYIPYLEQGSDNDFDDETDPDNSEAE